MNEPFFLKLSSLFLQPCCLCTVPPAINHVLSGDTLCVVIGGGISFISVSPRAPAHSRCSVRGSLSLTQPTLLVCVSDGLAADIPGEEADTPYLNLSRFPGVVGRGSEGTGGAAEQD